MVSNDEDEKLPLKKAISAYLKPLGFERKSWTWYKRTDESVLLVDLQKSDYGRQYYVNLAISYLAIDSTPYPKENHCAVRQRLGNIDDSGDLRSALNFEDESNPMNDKIAFIVRSISEAGLPFLEKHQSIGELKTQLLEGTVKAWVRGFVYEHLSIPIK